MKTCTRCGFELQSTLFRKRQKNGYTYLNSTCKKCDAEIRRINHNSLKNDPLYKQTNRKRALKWRIDNLDYALDVQRERIKTDTWKNYMKEYNEANKEKLSKQSLLRNRKHYYKIFSQIAPSYAKSKLLHPRTGLKSADISDEMIAIKRSEIAINRIKRIIKKIKNEK